jgi:OOP family OmpA-OmpF porin
MIKNTKKKIMKNKYVHAILSAILISASTAQAQEETYNRFSIDAVGGFSKVYRQHGLVTGISYPHIELCVRYMTNTKFGIRLQGGYNQFTNKPNASTANEFDVTYTRIGAEGVVNLGRVLNFESWTNRINVLMHAGPGGAWMNSKNSGTTDRVLNLNMGITGMIRLSDRIALVADMSNIINILQQRTFDMRSNSTTKGFDGGFMNFSAGMTV